MSNHYLRLKKATTEYPWFGNKSPDDVNPDRVRRLVFGIPYEPGSPEFCVETVERNVRAAVFGLPTYRGDAPADVTYPSVEKADKYPQVSIVPATEQVLVIDVDTASEDTREGSVVAGIAVLEQYLERRERNLLTRYKLWRQRRANEKAVRKQLNDMKARNGFS